MPRWKKSLLYGAYLIVSVGALLILGEVLLGLAHTVTDDRRLSPISGPDPEEFPDNVLRIALFGGSSAWGAYSVVDMEQAINTQLAETYPGTKFHLKNYALPGRPFHRHQAEILKAVIDDYDIFLIYSGHNEILNFMRDTCFRSDPALKCRKPSEWEAWLPVRSGPIGWIKTHSRILSITRKINAKYIAPRFSADNPPYVPLRPQLFELKKALPDADRKAIDDNFEADLRSIAELAEKKGKSVIISSVASHDEYMPRFSTHRAGLTETELNVFDNAFQRGLELFENGDYPGSINQFLIAKGIDTEPAILNYRIGRAYLHMGNVSRGRPYIRLSIDNDGLPFRSLSSLHRISESVASEYSSVRYVDTIQKFEDAIDSGYNMRELMIDYQHPDAIGHIIIARTFMSAMAELSSFKDFPANATNLESRDLREELSSYEVPIGIARHALFNSAAWHVEVAQFSADSSVILDAAKRQITNFYEITDKEPSDEALTLVMRAMIALQGFELEQAIKLGNKAAQISPDTINDALYGNVYLDGEIIARNTDLWFQSRGMVFSADTNEFTIMTVN